MGKLDMVVDVVLCQDEQVVRAFAGTPDGVFQEGVALARQVYEVACPGGMDIAVAAGYPYEINLYQAVRATEYAEAVVRKGGSVVLVAPCPDGIGGEEIYRLMSDATKTPDGFLRDVVRRNGRVTFSVMGYSLARIKAEKKLYIVTDGISAVELEAMGLRHLASLQDGVDALLKEYGPRAQVAVFPMGSTTVPVINQQSDGGQRQTLCYRKV
jgi:nickel-dependent lactate racemase